LDYSSGNNIYITLRNILFNLFMLLIISGSIVYFLSLNPQDIYCASSVPFIKPVEGAVITGFRQEYLDEAKQVTRQHTGIDILGNNRDKVKASGNGTVIYTGFSPIGGRTIVLKHNQKIRTTYLNLSEIFINIGNKVKQGDVIAAIGAEDDPSSLLPHLHFGIIYDGFYLDPEDILKIDYSAISKYILLQYCNPDFGIVRLNENNFPD